MIFLSNCRNDKKPDFVPFNHTLKLPNCRELLGRKVRLLWTKDDTEVYFRIQVHMEISQFAGKFRSIYLYNYYRIFPILWGWSGSTIYTIITEFFQKLSLKLGAIHKRRRNILGGGSEIPMLQEIRR